MKVEVLFPEICNLYGELSNIKFLSDSVKDMEVINTALFDVPYMVYHQPDLIYMGGMTEKGQEKVIEKLRPYKKRLEELIDKGVPMLFTSNAHEVFLEVIEDSDSGYKIDGLGIIKGRAVRRMMKRHNSLYLGSYEDEGADTKIVGFKSQFTTTILGKEYEPLFKTLRGFGFDGNADSDEGVRYNNFMATYVIGPLLILNPYFTVYLMNIMGIENPKLIYDSVVKDVYETRLAEFMEPDRGFTY